MGALGVIEVVLMLLKGVLSAANQSGAADVVTIVQAAIDKLNEVHGTDVTKAQVEALRITPQW